MATKTDRKFILILPATPGNNDSTATSSDRYQAARKLASTAYREVYSKKNQTKFDIVIMEKMTREKKKSIKEKKNFDMGKLFSAYSVTINKDSSTYEKAGKKLTSGFKPHITSMRNTPKADELVKAAMKAYKDDSASAA